MLDLRQNKGNICFFTIHYSANTFAITAFSKLKFIHNFLSDDYTCIIARAESIEHTCNFFLGQNYHTIDSFEVDFSNSIFVDANDNKIDCNFQLDELGFINIFCNQKEISKKLLSIPFLCKKQYPKSIPLGKKLYYNINLG